MGRVAWFVEETNQARPTWEEGAADEWE